MKMTMKPLKLLMLGAITLSVMVSCKSTAIISTPISNIDNTPVKFNELSEKEAQTWGHLDLVKDTIPGMSVDKAYDEIIKNRKGKKVIVAVIDSGIDIDHEDLDDVVWTNNDEIPNNGKDDDNNGFIDDIHGWNFLGDTYDEQMELTRILASGDTSHPQYAEAQAEHQKDWQKYSGLKAQYDQIIKQVNISDQAIAKHLGKDVYSKDEVLSIKTNDKMLQQHVSVIKQTYGFGFESVTEAKEALNNDLSQISDYVNFYLNKDFKGRKTGDDLNDITQTNYGNGNVKHSEKGESHGTHVAGIIAAERNNGKGVNGVANNVEIMAIRAVPNGDEYDKDIALAIRYAVDNGASIINGSFGKYYATNTQWVKDAIIYAGKNDVLIVHAAGNEGLDIDKKLNFPNDYNANGGELNDAFLSVGATEPKYGAEMIAGYSNYGKKNVDVFAPGSKIYSTFPENEYKAIGGTSMASPAVAGIAALIRSYYPKLTAPQVKQIIMDSGLPLKPKVVVGGDTNNVKPFADLSKSAKLVNAYNALILANKVSKN